MKLDILKGTTSKIVEVFIQDSSSSVGAGLAGVAFGDITAYYTLNGASGGATVHTPATMTIGTWASGGFIEKDATNMPGIYQLGVFNAALTGADSCVIMIKGATNMAPVVLEIQLVSYNPNDAVRMGMTSLPNAAVDGAGGLVTSAGGATGIDDLATPTNITAGTITTLTNKLGFNALYDGTIASFTSTTVFRLSGIFPADPTALQDAIAVFRDVTNNNTPSFRRVLTYTVSASPSFGEVTLSSAPDFTYANGDEVRFYPAAVAPTAAAIADAVYEEARADHTTAGSFGEPWVQLAQNLDNCAIGTASGTPTTTTMISDVAVTVDNQFNGRIITFDDDTTTAALQKQSTDITATTASTNTLTFTALTTAPVSGDTFTIT